MVITNGSFVIKVAEVQRPDVVHSSIKDVKDLLHECTGHPPSAQHLFHPSQPAEFRNASSLQELGIDQDGYTLMVLFDIKTSTSYSVEALKPELLDGAGSSMLTDVRVGLNRNQSPKVTDELDGSSGVYFFRSSNGQYAAVFKPRDEEQGMPNNPKSFQGTGQMALREHYRPGQGCLREVAAYILDHANFCGVPPTVLIHCQHSVLHYPKVGGKTRKFPKIGSLQRFITAPDCFDDFGPSQFSDFEVQKIALLDLRLLNCDRNGGNMLVRRKPNASMYHSSSTADLPNVEFEGVADETDWAPLSGTGSPAEKSDLYELIPIDHGYCMPSKLQITEYDLAWLFLPQVKRPVHPEIVAYVASLDFELLLRNVLDQIALPGNCIFLLALAHVLVVRGITAGLTLFDIASLVVRMESEDRPSKLELAIEEAEENAFRAVEFHNQRASNGQSISIYNPAQTTDYIEMDLSSSPNPTSRIVELGGIHLPDVPYSSLTPSRGSRFDGTSPGGSLSSHVSMNELRSLSGSPLRRLGSSPDSGAGDRASVTSNAATTPKGQLHPIDVASLPSTPRSKAAKTLSPSVSKTSFLRPALLTNTDSDAADGTSEDESIGDVDDQFLLDIFSTASSVDAPSPLHAGKPPKFHGESKLRGVSASLSSGSLTPSKTSISALPSIVEEKRHRENSVSSNCSSEHNGPDESGNKDGSSLATNNNAVSASSSSSGEKFMTKTAKGTSTPSMAPISSSSTLVSAMHESPRAFGGSNSLFSSELMATFPPMSNIGIPLMRLRSCNGSSPSPSNLLTPPMSSSGSLNSLGRTENENHTAPEQTEGTRSHPLSQKSSDSESFQHGEGLDIDESDAPNEPGPARPQSTDTSLIIVAPYLREHSLLSSGPPAVSTKCASSTTSLINGFGSDLDLDKDDCDSRLSANSGQHKRMYGISNMGENSCEDVTILHTEGDCEEAKDNELTQKRSRQGSSGGVSPAADAAHDAVPRAPAGAPCATPMRPMASHPVALNSAESNASTRSAVSGARASSTLRPTPQPTIAAGHPHLPSAAAVVPLSQQARDAPSDVHAMSPGLGPAPSLTRVVSFSGFPSAPIYELNAEGRFGNLRQEKRQAIAQTPQFNRFRLQFAHEAVVSLITRVAKGKASL